MWPYSPGWEAVGGARGSLEDERAETVRLYEKAARYHPASDAKMKVLYACMKPEKLAKCSPNHGGLLAEGRDRSSSVRRATQASRLTTVV